MYVFREQELQIIPSYQYLGCYWKQNVLLRLAYVTARYYPMENNSSSENPFWVVNIHINESLEAGELFLKL